MLRTIISSGMLDVLAATPTGMSAGARVFALAGVNAPVAACGRETGSRPGSGAIRHILGMRIGNSGSDSGAWFGRQQFDAGSTVIPLSLTNGRSHVPAKRRRRGRG